MLKIPQLNHYNHEQLIKFLAKKHDLPVDKINTLIRRSFSLFSTRSKTELIINDICKVKVIKVYNKTKKTVGNYFIK
jgi:hypothetical protein